MRWRLNPSTSFLVLAFLSAGVSVGYSINSRQARAEREKQARVILDSGDAAIAGIFGEAFDIYA